VAVDVGLTVGATGEAVDANGVSVWIGFPWFLQAVSRLKSRLKLMSIDSVRFIFISRGSESP
jgi:hypothetical protein